jgi:hypothetical protein
VPKLELHRNKESWESLPPGGSFVCDVPTLALHAINVESAGNYQFIDKESSRGRDIAGITSFLTQIQASKIKIRGKSFER